MEKILNITLPNQTDNICININGPKQKTCFQAYITRTDVGFVIDIWNKDGNYHIESITLWDEDLVNE